MGDTIGNGTSSTPTREEMAATARLRAGDGGIDPLPMRAGDILLVKNNKKSLISDLIMAGERADYGNTEYAEWTHAALIVSELGDLIEWHDTGCRLAHTTDYNAYETHVIDTKASKVNRAMAVRRAYHFLDTHSKYDFIDYIGLVGVALFRWDISVHSDKRFICSGGVCRCCINYVVTWPKAYEQMTPADLAHYYHVHAGIPIQPHSLIGRCLDTLRAVTRTL